LDRVLRVEAGSVSEVSQDLKRVHTLQDPTRLMPRFQGWRNVATQRDSAELPPPSDRSPVGPPTRPH
jgi:hypothetical protein